MDALRLAAYLPMDRRQALAAGDDLPARAAGAVLLADVVGFTRLTEGVVATLGQRRGVEEVAGLLNEVYDALVGRVHDQGGSIVGFSGDGFVAWFDGDDGLRAAACGLALQESTTAFAGVSIEEGARLAPSLKVALVAGPVRRLLVGAPQQQCLDVLAGATLDRLARAAESALPGQVVADAETARHLGALAWGEAGPGVAIVAGLAQEVKPAPWPELPRRQFGVEQVRPFLLPPVYERLAAGQGEFLAELRPVAALFVRFGELDYDGDEAAGAKLDAFVRWVQGVLAQYGGYLLQLTTGDKGSYLYAAFGAPVAHEDDADRAVAAAQALQRRPRDLGFIRDVQVGVSWGRARVGAYGGRGRRTYGALGDEVNLAARLMQAAPPGEIWCSERIYEAAEGFFEAMPPISIKGKAGLLPVYRPVALPRLGPDRVPAPAGGALVGREAEVQALHRLLAEAQAGRQRILLLEGEAGIGKSRLVAELARLAGAAGFTWLAGAGQSIEQQTPFRAWREVLAAYFGLAEGVAPAVARRQVLGQIEALDSELVTRAPLLNDILGLDLPETALTQSLAPRLRHESLTALIVELLRAGPGAGPWVLVLEDAQWLDSLSWALTLAVARALEARPLLLVVVLRPPEASLPAAYGALAGLPASEKRLLGAMSGEETVRLAAARLGVAAGALPPEVEALVRERAGGNPFFAEELAQALLEDGVVVVDGEGCRLAGGPQALRRGVPDTIEGLVLARIDRLAPEKQLTLKVAAVVGRRFLYRTVRDVHPRQVVEAVLRDHLADLARRDLTPVEALEPELTYLFKHIIIQQVAYETLLFAQRRTLHRTVAGWYEGAYGEQLVAYYPLLLHHWSGAGDAAQERRYARLAGEQAAAQYANQEAVAYLSRALALTPEEETEARYPLLLTREKVYDLQGARDAQRQDLETLQGLAQALADDAKRIEAALRRASFEEVTSDYAAAIAAAQEATDLARQVGDRQGQARGHLIWGRAYWRQGDHQTALGQIEQALALARGVGARQLEADCLRSQGIVRWFMDDSAAAWRHYEKALALYRQIGDRQGESTILSNLGAVAYVQEEYAASRDYLEQSLAGCRALGIRRGESVALGNLAALYDYLGDYERAAGYYEQALRISREIGNRRGESWLLADMGLFYHNRGDDDRAETSSRQALALALEIDDRHVQGLAWTHLGHALGKLGVWPEATDAYRQAIEIRQELEEQSRIVEPLAGLARLALAQGDVEEASEYVAQILDRLAQGEPESEVEPIRIYLTCYRVLEAGGDPRAGEILARAYNLLQEQAGRIGAEDLRRSFLENVPTNREVRAAYRRGQGG